MALNETDYASYPTRLHGLKAVADTVPYADPMWMEDFAAPDASFRLTVIALDRINPESNDQHDYSVSGNHFATDGFDNTPAEDLERLGAMEHPYEELELAILRWENVAPLVVRQRPDGTFESMDGWHRASIARHLGREEFPAYVHDPRVNLGGLDDVELAVEGTQVIAHRGSEMIGMFDAATGQLASEHAAVRALLLSVAEQHRFEVPEAAWKPLLQKPEISHELVVSPTPGSITGPVRP